MAENPGQSKESPERPDGSTLRLIREVVEEIGTNEAVAAGGTLFGTTIHVVPMAYAEFEEPPLPVLRHLLDLLRHLDMPSSDKLLSRQAPMGDG